MLSRTTPQELERIGDVLNLKQMMIKRDVRHVLTTRIIRPTIDDGFTLMSVHMSYLCVKCKFSLYRERKPPCALNCAGRRLCVRF